MASGCVGIEKSFAVWTLGAVIFDLARAATVADRQGLLLPLRQLPRFVGSLLLFYRDARFRRDNSSLLFIGSGCCFSLGARVKDSTFLFEHSGADVRMLLKGDLVKRAATLLALDKPIC